jgi:hypothetical protein
MDFLFFGFSTGLPLFIKANFVTLIIKPKTYLWRSL